MATVYNILPLTMENKVLTVAMADPGNLAALDDLRNLLGITEVKPAIASAKAVAEAITRYYAGKEETILDLIQQLEAHPELGQSKNSRPSTWTA